MIVAAALIIEEGRVLVARRAEGHSLAGYWEFPGGKLEAGESILACLEREMREELGVECRAEKVFFELDYPYPEGVVHLVGVVAALVTRDMRLSVHDGLLWADAADLARLELAPADVAMAERLRGSLSR